MLICYPNVLWRCFTGDTRGNLRLNHLNHLRLSISTHIYAVIILNLRVKTSLDFLAFIFAMLHANFQRTFLSVVVIRRGKWKCYVTIQTDNVYKVIC